MTNLDSILKSRDITLQTKVRLVKAMVFPVKYGCESWTIKKAEVAQLCLTLCAPGSPALQIDSLPTELSGKPKES